MADINQNDAVETKQTPDTTSSEPKKQPGQKAQPSYEELALELAKVNAEKAKFKNSIDKLTHENSELTKWKRERMSAQEQQDEADAEAKAAQEAYVKELEDYKAINEASKRYIAMGMGIEIAMATATAEVQGDMETVLKNVNQNKQDAITAAKAEWLKSRPDIPDGSVNNGITQEQFDAMNMFERTKLLRSDPETYRRLVGK